jgi:hypothetical protein
MPHVFRSESEKMNKVKEWLQSDDPYGLTYKPKDPQPNLFPSFTKWQEEARVAAEKANGKGGKQSTF